MKEKTLFMHEELMLLALQDEKGTLESGGLVQYAIGGALLAELLLEGSVRVEADDRKKIVSHVRSRRLGDALLDECLERIANAGKRASLQTWLTRFAGIRHLARRAALGLCERGILKADERQVLLIFTRRIYPEIDPRPERELVERLRRAIFTDAREVDPRTVVVISLAHRTGLLKRVFPGKELRGRKDRIERIVNGELTGKAAHEAIQAMQAAVMVATMAAMTATTAATSARGR